MEHTSIHDQEKNQFENMIFIKMDFSQAGWSVRCKTELLDVPSPVDYNYFHTKGFITSPFLDDYKGTLA